MKLILDNNQLSRTPEMFLRRAGYVYLEDRRTGNESFVRPLNRGYYPRFHLYLDQLNDKVILNLHLDQKQASYAGAHAHNAEYDGELVIAEMERIKNLVTHNLPAPASVASAKRVGEAGLEPVTQNENYDIADTVNILDKIRPGQFNESRKKVEKKSWWRKFFR